MRERFTDRPVERSWRSKFHWPRALHAVGDSLAVAYSSDKWQKPNRTGERELLDYKHLAESRNRVLIRPGLLYDFYHKNRAWPVIGPMVSLDDVPVPDSYAFLALFEEANLQLYTEGTDLDPHFGPGEDDGVCKVTVRHGMLAGSVIGWSEDGGKDQPILFVYTEQDGILMVVVGEKLAVEKDGIVG
jgi:hypothetical protein